MADISKINGREIKDNTAREMIDDLKIQEYINIKSFGAIGDGEADDTSAIQDAINTAFDNKKAKVVFPSGNYKITSTIVSYPQVTLVSEGFVQLESYITDDPCIHIKYPIDNPGLKYVGDIINGSNGGFYINNKLVDYENTTTPDWKNADWGGNNIGLQLGTSVTEHDINSDTRYLARYGISDVYINNFRTGILIGQRNHFMAHFRQVRIALSDICVQVGETVGFNDDMGIENFAWTSCMFERSNTVMKWIRNGVEQVFDKCSIDFIRGDAFINTVSGIPRLYFNGCWLEKLRGLFFNHTQSNAYTGIGNNIYFKGCHMLLPFRQLFKTVNNRTSITIEDCSYLRDYYYAEIDNEEVDLFEAINRYMCDKNTVINNISLTPYENSGLPMISENYNSLTDGGFKKVLGTYDLKAENPTLPIWWDSILHEGMASGILEISDLSDGMIDGYSYYKSIKLQPSQSSNFAQLTINTNKIKVNKNKKLSIGLLIKANDYEKISFVISVDYYDYNDRKILDTIQYTRDYEGSSLKEFKASKWNVLNLIPQNEGSILVPPRGVEYMKLTIKCINSDPNVLEEITGFYVEEL